MANIQEPDTGFDQVDKEVVRGNVVLDGENLFDIRQVVGQVEENACSVGTACIDREIPPDAEDPSTVQGVSSKLDLDEEIPEVPNIKFEDPKLPNSYVEKTSEQHEPDESRAQEECSSDTDPKEESRETIVGKMLNELLGVDQNKQCIQIKVRTHKSKWLRTPHIGFNLTIIGAEDKEMVTIMLDWNMRKMNLKILKEDGSKKIREQYVLSKNSVTISVTKKKLMAIFGELYMIAENQEYQLFGYSDTGKGSNCRGMVKKQLKVFQRQLGRDFKCLLEEVYKAEENDCLLLYGVVSIIVNILKM